METVRTEGLTPVIDLSTVDHEKRAHIWADRAPTIFPGVAAKVTVNTPSVGTVRRAAMGPGSLIAISSAPAEVSYAPTRVEGQRDCCVTLLLQTDGSMIAQQRQRRAQLQPGDICLVDEAQPFRLTGLDCSQILLLRMPRAMVLSRFPDIERLFAAVMPSNDAGTNLLAQTLFHLLGIAPGLRPGQQNAALNGIIQLLGVTSCVEVELERTHWRVRKALDYIALNLSEPGLSAEQVAGDQHISRRRLDQLMREARGLSITGQIWRARLERAAEDLRDPRWVDCVIAQIAFANGFEDAAHFTRAFKKHFAVTPGRWRASPVAAPH